MHLVTK